MEQQEERDLSDRPSVLSSSSAGRSVGLCCAAMLRAFPPKGTLTLTAEEGTSVAAKEGGGTRRRRRPHSERPTSNGGSKNISPSSRACACEKEPSDLGTTIIKV